jgi:hypothetical protein
MRKFAALFTADWPRRAADVPLETADFVLTERLPGVDNNHNQESRKINIKILKRSLWLLAFYSFECRPSKDFRKAFPFVNESPQLMTLRMRSSYLSQKVNARRT